MGDAFLNRSADFQVCGRRFLNLPVARRLTICRFVRLRFASTHRAEAQGEGGNRRLVRSLPLAQPFGPCLRLAPAIPFAASRAAQVSRFGNLRYAHEQTEYPLWGIQ